MKKPLLPVVLLAALAACSGSDSTLPELTGTQGALRFDYSGPVSGSFSAQGDGVSTGAPGGTEWAVGTLANGRITLQASQVLAGGRTSMMTLVFPVQGSPAFTVTVDRAKCPVVMENCPGGLASLLYLSNGTDNGHHFEFALGEIRVTRMEGGRIRGTFSGSGLGSGAEGTLQFQHGSFDVPLIQF